MDMKNYHTVVGVIFLAVAVMHVLRLMNGWAVNLGPWSVPMWVSYFGVVVGGYLSYTSFKLNK